MANLDMANQRVQLNFKYAEQEDPDSITLGLGMENGEHCCGNYGIRWDEKTPLVLWFNLSMSVQEFLDYCHTTPSGIESKKYEGQPFGKRDTVTVTAKTSQKGPDVQVDAKGEILVSGGEVRKQSLECDCNCRIGYIVPAADILEAAQKTHEKWAFPKGDPIHYAKDGTLLYLHNKKQRIALGNFCVTITVISVEDEEPDEEDEDRRPIKSYTLDLNGVVG